MDLLLCSRLGSCPRQCCMKDHRALQMISYMVVKWFNKYRTNVQKLPKNRKVFVEQQSPIDNRWKEVKGWEAELTFHLSQLCKPSSFQNIAGINCQGSVELGGQALFALWLAGSFHLLLLWVGVILILLKIDRNLLKYIFPCQNSSLCTFRVAEQFMYRKGCKVHNCTQEYSLYFKCVCRFSLY